MGIVANRVSRVGHLGPAVGADLCGVVALERELPLASDSNAGASAVGESDDHAAPIVRVWVAAHEIEPLELVYKW